MPVSKKRHTKLKRPKTYTFLVDYTESVTGEWCHRVARAVFATSLKNAVIGVRSADQQQGHTTQAIFLLPGDQTPFDELVNQTDELHQRHLDYQVVYLSPQAIEEIGVTQH